MVSGSSSRISLILFLGILAGTVLFFAYMVVPYVLAILMGAVLATLTKPLYKRLLEKGVAPKLAAALVTTAVLLLVITPLFLFAAHSLGEGIDFGQQFLAEQNISVQALAAQTGRRVLRSFISDPEMIRSQVRAFSENSVKWLTNSILVWAGAIPSILFQLALSSITCFFLLLDGRKLINWLSDKIPLDSDVRAEIKQSFQNTAVSVIWANLAAASTQALILSLGFLALGIPGAFLAGGATFILAWIPMVGTVPVWVAGSVYLYSQGDIPRVVIMVIVGLIASVTDNFVRPLVLKGRSDMHPLVSLIAIFGGINLFGIMGAFVGPILAAVLISLLDIWPIVGRRFGLLKGEDRPAVPL